MAEHKSIEQQFLPREMKLDMCVTLLENMGADKISVRDNRDEIIHCCVMPWHQESRPSASLNFEKLTFRCLTGDTLIKTYEGEVPIGDVSGQIVKVLDGQGKWVSSPIKHYGKDQIYEVVLTRNGVTKTVTTTADHRWYTRPHSDYSTGSRGLKEKTTATLKPKDRIPSVWAMTRTGRTTISPVGVMAGFVFGDGSRTQHGAVANFFGEKDDALRPYFQQYEIHPYEGVSKVVAGLPRSWKDLPSLDEGQSYLWGWLAGYFSADGCVADDGHVTLACASKDTLKFVQTVCDRLGVATYTLGGRSRVGRSGANVAAEASMIYSLSFRSSTLTDDFFLIPAHRARFEEARRRRKYERTHWWVRSVTATDRVEDVYCAEVSTTQSFVLADNVLTGNCLGCNAKGGFLWLIETALDLHNGGEAREWLAGISGMGGSEFQLAPLLDFLDNLDEAMAKGKVKPVTPTYSKKVLEPWNHVYPGLTSGAPDLGIVGRGIPEENLVECQVGWNMETNRVVIPHFVKGDLVGWQSRRIMSDGTPKYQSTPDFPRDTTFYGLPSDLTEVHVVESPMSRLRHLHHAPVAASWGAVITPHQIQALKWFKRVVFFSDNDDAGWRTIEGYVDSKGQHHQGAAQELALYTQVDVVQYDWHGDPADLDDAEYDRLISEAVPVWIWDRPQGALRCLACRECHGGPCPSKEPC